MKKCIKINKNLAVPAVGILIAGLALFAGRSVQPENGFTLNQYHNADAKFIGDHIITSVDEQIRILDLEGQEVRRFEGTQASWIYVMEDDGGNELQQNLRQLRQTAIQLHTAITAMRPTF